MRWFGVLAGAAMVVLSLPARADLVVTISKSQQRMSVVVDGSEAHRWLVSTGRGRYATPSGEFHPLRFARHWYSRKYDNAPMPYSIFYHKGYAIHGTIEVRRLGRAASHGCIRLHPANAAVLFALARAHGAGNTRIVVTDSPLQGGLTKSPQAAPKERGFESFGKPETDVKGPAPAARKSRHKPVQKPADKSVDKSADKSADLASSRPEVSGSRRASRRGDALRLPRSADVMTPGTHVVTMRIGSQTELRAVYRKYGFTW